MQPTGLGDPNDPDSKVKFLAAEALRGVSLDWSKAIESFDRPERHGVDSATLKLLVVILTNSPRDAVPPAVAGFWTKCSNPSTNFVFSMRFFPFLTIRSALSHCLVDGS